MNAPNAALAIDEDLDREFLVHGEYGGEHLGARPLPLTIEKLRELWELHSRHKIFFDDLALYSFERFGAYAIQHMTMPIEVVTIPERKHVGVCCLTDVIQAETEPGVVNAFFHGSYWDGDAAHRRELTKQVIRIWVKVLRIHRLMALVPAKAVGALNQLSKLGFGGAFDYQLSPSRPGKTIKVEGVWRQAKKMEGEWISMVQVAMTADELERL